MLLRCLMCAHVLASSSLHACEREPCAGSEGFYFLASAAVQKDSDCVRRRKLPVSCHTLSDAFQILNLHPSVKALFFPPNCTQGWKLWPAGPIWHTLCLFHIQCWSKTCLGSQFFFPINMNVCPSLRQYLIFLHPDLVTKNTKSNPLQSSFFLRNIFGNLPDLTGGCLCFSHISENRKDQDVPYF